MKVKQLIIKNIGIIEDADIELNKPLILFYGEIRQGKTTILNAVKWLFGGSFPSDIIRHGETEASVTLVLDNGSITREWYVAKDETTKAREITFILDGRPVKRPVDEIKKFLNPYLLDNEYLKKMSESERKAYFTQLFAVDLAELNIQIDDADRKAKELRAKLKGYGEIDLTRIEPTNVTAAREELAQIKQQHSNDCLAVEQRNQKIRNHNLAVREELIKEGQYKANILEIERKIQELHQDLERNRNLLANAGGFLGNNPIRQEEPKPEPPETSVLEQQISDAAAQQVRVEQYQQNLKRAAARDADQQKLAALEKTAKEIKKTKLAKLKEISSTCGIKGLAFDIDGNFTYEGTQSGMLSTAQIMKLSAELSALYPSGFGLDLIDRGESLGKSVFDLVKQAEEQGKTTLVAVVSEKPAVIPENIGVFVVEEGKVKAA